jgi:opacity protein-like surface antigen
LQERIMGIAGKALIAVIVTLAFCASAAYAQDERAPSFSAPHGSALAGTRNYLGLNIGRGLETNCPAAQLFCESRDRSAQLFAGTMFDRNWGAEVAYVDTGHFLRSSNDVRAQGLAVSVVGRAQLLPSVGVFGKVGTAYGRSDTSVMGNAGAGSADPGFGLAYGGGFSYSFSPRLSAKLEWDSYDLRVGGGPVRSTSLGLQFRY